MIDKNKKNFVEVVVLQLLTELTTFCRIVSVLNHCHFYTKIQREKSENIFTHCVINALFYSYIYKELL